MTTGRINQVALEHPESIDGRGTDGRAGVRSSAYLTVDARHRSHTPVRPSRPSKEPSRSIAHVARTLTVIHCTSIVRDRDRRLPTRCRHPVDSSLVFRSQPEHPLRGRTRKTVGGSLTWQHRGSNRRFRTGIVPAVGGRMNDEYHLRGPPRSIST